MASSSDPIGYTADGAAYCPECAAHRFGVCVDGWVGCPDPAHVTPGQEVPGAVFETDSSSFEDGGLSCDTCAAVIVENDTCPTCATSLRDHDTYEFGPTGRRVRVDGLCPGRHATAEVAVREHVGSGPLLTSTAYTVEVVPFDLPSVTRDRIARGDDVDLSAPADFGGGSAGLPDEPSPVSAALDAIMAAYAGKVATFDVLSAEVHG